MHTNVFKKYYKCISFHVSFWEQAVIKSNEDTIFAILFILTKNESMAKTLTSNECLFRTNTRYIIYQYINIFNSMDIGQGNLLKNNQVYIDRQ